MSSRAHRFFHMALDFVHHMHHKVKHVVHPIKMGKRGPKAGRISSDSRSTSESDQPQENDTKNPIKKLVCQNCEAAKIAQSVSLGRKLDVPCKTVGSCAVGGLITPPKLVRDRKWVPKVTKHRKTKEKAVAKSKSPNKEERPAAVAIAVQPPSPQKGSLASGAGGCCGGGCGCGSSQNKALLTPKPTSEPHTTAATGLATPGCKGALLAIATRTPRKPTLKALSTPVKTPRKTLATPSPRRRNATPRRSPRNNELRRIAQAGRAGRTATMVGLGSLMGARAFTGGSVAFLGISFSTAGIQVVSSTVESVNSPRLLLTVDKGTDGPGTPSRSLWNTQPRTPYHNHIRNVKTRSSTTKAQLSASPLLEKLGRGSGITPSHHQIILSDLNTPKMRPPIAKVISPIPYDPARTPVKAKLHGVTSAFDRRFTKSPQISFRSTPLGTGRQPAPTMSLSSAIRAAGITAGPMIEPDFEDVFEPSFDFAAVPAIDANYPEKRLHRQYI